MPDHVGAELRVEEGGAGAPRRVRIHHRRERLVGDGDALEGVLGGGAVHRGDGGDGLADEARAIDGEAVILDARGGGDEGADGAGQARRVRAREHRDHAGQGGGRARIDGDDAGVRVRAPEHGGVEQARRAQVVDEAPASGHQAAVLLEGERGAHPRAAHARDPAARLTARTMLT